jgi:hypothetical protein
MIYSISVQADFESIGREMPKGTGIDNSVNDGTVARGTKGKHKGKQYKKKKRNSSEESNKVVIKPLRLRMQWMILKKMKHKVIAVMTANYCSHLVDTWVLEVSHYSIYFYSKYRPWDWPPLGIVRTSNG